MVEVTEKTLSLVASKILGGSNFSEADRLEMAAEILAAIASPAEPVAWMDDGSLRAGSVGTAFRVVSAETKRDMPKASAENFTTPLYAHPPQQEPARLREALKSARHYVVDAIDADGGIDSCEIQHRFTLEAIDAALAEDAIRVALAEDGL